MLSPTDSLPAPFLISYRRLFGLNLLLEQLYFSNTVIHVVYEKWEPCFVPAFRSWGIPVTHYIVDFALYCGIALSIFFIFDNCLIANWMNKLVSISLFLTYSFLRIINFYSWNNHYYVNMILLAMFTIIPGGGAGCDKHNRPRWQFQVIQVFFGIVYFMAGVSKLSTAWMGGSITETMIMNHKIVLPNWMMFVGGFALDFFGGLVVIADALFRGIPRTVTIINHLNLLVFHAHNLIYMFSSIQFFPLHMLFTISLFLPAELGLDKERLSRRRPIKESLEIVNDVVVSKPISTSRLLTKKRIGLGGYFCWLIVLAQFVFSLRRFVLLPSHGLFNILAINDAAEYHSQFHQFGWRMKSKTIATRIKVKGKGPMAAVVGISSPEDLEDHPEKTKYMHPSKINYGGDIDDVECAIQPLVNKMEKLKPWLGKNSEVVVNFFLWQEINHGAYQLLVNPDLNFINAHQLPFFEPPDWNYIEPRVLDSHPAWSGWSSEVAETHVADAVRNNMTLIPFVANARPRRWIPNPLLVSDSEDLQPSWIVCIYGEMLIRLFDEATTECGMGASFVLPQDGQFHFKFQTDSLFLLAFEQSVP
jgi:hypothetical protein